MFQLTDHPTLVRDYNPRAETHGTTNVLAGDLSIEITAHSSVLDNFDPKLRPLLFRAPEHENEQPRADDDLTELRRPQLGDLDWNEKFPGYTLEIGSLDAVDPLVIKEVTLSGFTFSPQQGGVVKMKFKASCRPSVEVSGQLSDLIKDTVDVTLTPPAGGENDAQGDIFKAEQSTADAAAAAIEADEQQKAA